MNTNMTMIEKTTNNQLKLDIWDIIGLMMDVVVWCVVFLFLFLLIGAISHSIY